MNHKSNSLPDSEAPQDLESKTANGFYPSSDEEDVKTTKSRRDRRNDRVRNFRKDDVDSAGTLALPTPRGWEIIRRRPNTDVSKSSGFTLSSAKKGADNPYSKSSRKHVESASVAATYATRMNKRQSSHIVCAISENLARETCVSTLDAARPTTLQITKQGNGQTYAETLALLKIIGPHEVLLNEGRKNSLLAGKVLGLFGLDKEDVSAQNVPFGEKRRKNRQKDDDATTPPEETVVKFLPRSYFDQTKGAETLRKLSREDKYNATLVEEYILLSSSYAVLQYVQLCIGAGLSRHSLTLDVNAGGSHRMMMDRATMTNLELLVNAKTGKTAHSLVGSIDCTKTSVGGKLLRTNLMAPPTRLDTIRARLDLVDAFLEDEEFFYVVMEHLEDLPDVDKMLSCVALVPRGKSNNSALRGVTARQASRGISALVCIKSTLSVIPSFAHVLEVQLREIIQREGTMSGARGTGEQDCENTESCTNKGRPRSGRDDESTTVVDSERSDAADSWSDGGFTTDRNDATMTKCSSLDIGLGTSVSLTNNQFNSSSMKQTRHQLLQAILIAMKQPALTHVLNAVTDIFTESTAYSKNSHAMRHQECFALKPNTDGMMDILRKAFLANVDDIYRLADKYAETYDINVQVKETAARGYYLSVSADLGLDLPRIFIQPVRNGRFIHCTTEEVYSLNSRAQENVQDLLLMTHERIQEVLAVARKNYDSLASLSDAIALLDMCHSFADNVASSRLTWCRPRLSDSNNNEDDDEAYGGGAIAIRNGRYAIDVGSGASAPTPEFVPNDTYASALQNFTIITGVNGSGKSTYLKQIALIVILAHCGSFVPAEEALIPIRDQICTRIGTVDDQEHNISTFLMEMKETAFICNSTTEKSLFLLDELGRATSNEDGVAVAWAVSEFLLTKRAITFFVTHYPQISKLDSVYTNVQNQHLGSHINSSPNNQDGSSINYTHKIMPGPCAASGDYGVEMTVSCGFPHDVVSNARMIRRHVEEKLPGAGLCEHHNDSVDPEYRRNARKILSDLSKHLTALKESEGRLKNDSKRIFLQDLRDRMVPPNNASVVKELRNLLLNENKDVTIPFVGVKNTSAESQTETAHESSGPVEMEVESREVIVETEVQNERTRGENSKSKAPRECTEQAISPVRGSVRHAEDLPPTDVSYSSNKRQRKSESMSSSSSSSSSQSNSSDSSSDDSSVDSSCSLSSVSDMAP